ncbi:cyclin-dependent protein kinase inhibitor SMR10-like [Durio zibethinus]|uniref:Cyclin-dependent protein kinase inhibitor SMR10-like n=1 Tax=Durio zibethinus TaxID=66656 RepID=A0A6P5Z421_DURZI|nr:cyclin-dependent protein kinase inhibitor SMR10-like [Durio zibethinus]
MYAEFSQISLLSMSNSELFLVKGDEEGMEFDILKRPALEFQEECQATATSSSHDRPGDHQERDALGDHEEKKGGERNVTASNEREKKKNISLGEFKATDDDDYGFKTPTTLDQKIPVMKQCPPAPKKPKPLPSNKRKASTPSSGGAANLQLDLSQQVESLFPRPLIADLHRKVKKARTKEKL